MKQLFFRSGIYWFLAISMLIISGCDGREAANQTSPAATTETTEQQAEPAAVDEPKSADGAAQENLELRGVTETEGLTPSPATQDETTLSEPAKETATGQTTWKYKEGEDYR